MISLKKLTIDKNSGIYKITSPTGRIYIGQSRNIRRRFIDYKGGRHKKQPKLNNSFNKYGADNHDFTILENCSILKLNERERYWQDFYDVLNGGLNCVLTNTEDLPLIWSDESKILKGNSIKQFHLDKHEPIYQFNLNGKLLKIWKNRSEVILNFSEVNSDNLTACLTGRRLYIKDFIWSLNSLLSFEFLEDVKDLLIKIDNRIVNQYDLEGNFIKQWKHSKQIKKGFKYSSKKTV